MSAASNTHHEFVRRKFAIFLAMYTGYTMYILVRKSFSFSMPIIKLEEGLDKDDLGLISSSQMIAYAGSKFLGGLISDVVSPKKLFSCGLLLSGLTTFVFSLSHSKVTFALLWFLSGLAQGPGWPACVKMLRQWFTVSEFGTWWGILSTSMNLACSGGPLLSLLFLKYFSWTFLFQLFGLLSIFVSLLCFMTMVESPEELGFSCAQTSSKEVRRGRGTWQDMMTSPLMLIISGGYFVVFMVRMVVLDWGQLYLIEELHHELNVGSWFVSMFEFGGIAGSIIAGFAADTMVAMKKRDDMRGTPRISILLFFIIALVALLHTLVFCINSESSELFIMVLAFGLGFCVYGPISLYGVMAIESAPTHLSGTSHAIVALAANCGGIVAGLPFSILATKYEWSGAFFFLEILVGMTFVMHLLTRNVEYKMVATRKKIE